MAMLIGLIVGLVLGLTGAGGSIFAVPLLMFVLSLPISDAMGLSLGAVALSAAIGTLRQAKTVLWLPVAMIALGGMLFAPLGKWLADSIPETLLMLLFATLAFSIAIHMYRQARLQPELSHHLRGNKALIEYSSSTLSCRLSQSGQFQMRPRCIFGLILGGSGIGFASGIFGVGGGFLIIPLLIHLSAISMPKAIACSLAIITLISGTGFFTHLGLNGLGHISLLLQVCMAAMLGMLLSLMISHKLAGPQLQKIFSLLLIAMSLYLLINLFN